MEAAEEEQKELNLASPGVLEKYQAAAKICNAALEEVVKKIQPGADIMEICAAGDAYIEEAVKGVYNKKGSKSVEKGIGFPTCISVNELCGHFSPLEDESSQLKEGDVCKIDLGVQIDGFIATGGHTVVCQEGKVEGRKADVILAAHTAAEAALRLIRPGNTNQQVTDAIQLACDTYNCNALEGVLSHEMKQHLIDGNRVIINKETIDNHVETFEFQPNEVYGLDIIVSTGEGKSKEADIKTSVFKRAIENTYSLKLKNSRAFFKEVNQRFPTLPFTLRAMEDSKAAKMGVIECVSHELLYPYPVMTEKSGEFVAQFKYTVLLLGKGTQAVTGIPLNADNFSSEHKVENEELKKILQTSMAQKKQKKNKKKKEAATAQETGAEKKEEESK